MPQVQRPLDREADLAAVQPLGSFDRALDAIAALTQILAREFPARGVNPNELPDRPAVL